MRFSPPAYLLLVIATVIWGGNFVVGRAFHGDIGPFSLNFWRWALSGALLAPFVMRGVMAHMREVRENLFLLFVLAFTGMVMFHSLIYWALASTTAINAALVLASMPLVIPVIAYMAGLDRLRPVQGVGIAVSFAGVGTIIARGDMENLLGLDFAIGDLLVLGAVVMWSVYSVMLRRVPKNLPPMVVLAVANWMAVVMLAPLYIHEISRIGGFSINAPNLTALAYVGVFASIVAFVSWNRAVAMVGPNISGLFIHVIPLSSAVLAIIFLGESLEMYHFVGALPIVAGILITTRGRGSRQP